MRTQSMRLLCFNFPIPTQSVVAPTPERLDESLVHTSWQWCNRSEAIFIPLQIGKNSDLLVLKPLHKHIVSATSPIGSHSFFVLLPIWFFQHPPTIGRRHFLAQSPSSFETAERAWRTGSENSFWKSCCFNRKEGKEQGYNTRAGRTCKVICHQIFSDWSEGKDTHRMEETQCSNFLYKKCLKNFPIGFGNGNHTTYKNGDLGDGLLLFYPHAYLGYIWYMDFRRCVSSVLYVMAWGPSNPRKLITNCPYVTGRGFR